MTDGNVPVRGDDLAVGDVVEMDIGPVAHGGHCVARFDGRVVFVRHGLPGERVRARMTEVRPGSFCRAEVLDVLAADPGRVVAPCAHFHPGGCGGCDFQHASSALQRELKAAVVAEQLRRLAGLELDVTVTPLPGDGFGWRTRVRWALDEDGRIGPRRYRSHLVEAVGPQTPCLIAAPGLTELAAVLEVPETVRLRRVAAGRQVSGREASGRDAPGREVLGRGVSGRDTGRASGRAGSRGRREGRGRRGGERREQPSRSGAGSGPEVSLVATGGTPLAVWEGAGPTAPTVTELAAGRSFEVAADGFWQVHPAAADTLAAAVDLAVADHLQPGGTAWDLYGGVGLFAAVLAARVGSAGRVLTVEQDRAASVLAAANLADLPQVLAVTDRVDAMLSRPADLLPAAHGRLDAVVLDPPRSGAGAQLCRRIAERKPAVIVYVACDPAALGRDTAALLSSGYRLDGLQAFDCFPQTHHVECVVTFLPA